MPSSLERYAISNGYKAYTLSVIKTKDILFGPANLQIYGTTNRIYEYLNDDNHFEVVLHEIFIDSDSHGAFIIPQKYGSNMIFSNLEYAFFAISTKSFYVS